MPDGDKYNVQVPNVLGNYGRGAKLVDNVPSTAATAGVYVGPWVDVSTLKSATVDVNGTSFVGTVNIEGSNLDNPVSASNGNALCTPLTGSGFSALIMPVRYARARISGFTGGSVSVQLHGVS